MSVVVPLQDLSSEPTVAAPGPTPAEGLATVRIPHVTIHAFHDSRAFAGLWRSVAQDRRLASATTAIRPGGFAAARDYCARERSPDLMVVDTDVDGDALLCELDALAELCRPETRLIVVGRRNDIHLYRRLIDMGVSSYIVAPVSVPGMIAAIAEIYRQPGMERIGRVTAVIGAKGGVGASTLAQSLALALSRRQGSDTLLVDLDLAFGTAALDLDVEPNQGLTEMIHRAEPIDGAMLDRVVIRRGAHLVLLGPSPSLENGTEIDEGAIERIVDLGQTNFRRTVLDLPHLWAPWVERAVSAADDVVVVATPELGSLRNAVAVIGRARALRPNDEAPRLVLNQVGVPRRQEITPRDIAKVLKVEPALSIPFDARAFSLAAARGRMVAEVAARRPVARAYDSLARMIAPETAPARRHGPLSALRRRRGAA